MQKIRELRDIGRKASSKLDGGGCALYLGLGVFTRANEGKTFLNKPKYSCNSQNNP